MLFIRSKIQFFESKSQRNRETATQGNGCLSDQRYNFLKANHNFCSYKCKENIVVYQIKDTIFWKQITTLRYLLTCSALLFIRSKIQFFESKSQLSWFTTSLLNVVYQIKDTIFWKQITTIGAGARIIDLLFIRSKIQFFESKSQRRF